MAKPVRRADIAEKLGISIVSVSKALAGKPGVSEEMRARVAALAKEMGYEPAKARGAAGATNNIGVLVSDRSFSENPGDPERQCGLYLHDGDRLPGSGAGGGSPVPALRAEGGRHTVHGQF